MPHCFVEMPSARAWNFFYTPNMCSTNSIHLIEAISHILTTIQPCLCGHFIQGTYIKVWEINISISIGNWKLHGVNTSSADSQNNQSHASSQLLLIILCLRSCNSLYYSSFCGYLAISLQNCITSVPPRLIQNCLSSWIWKSGVFPLWVSNDVSAFCWCVRVSLLFCLLVF